MATTRRQAVLRLWPEVHASGRGLGYRRRRTVTQPAETGLRPGRVVHADLIVLEVYAIYKAITDLWGEKGWDVIWRTGDIAWQELKRDLEITETEPLPLMRQIGKWLVEVGYLKEMVVTQPREGELIYEMEAPVVKPATLRLREFDAVLPHWSTTIMVAALREVCGLEAEMEDLKPELPTPTRSLERWRLRPVR